MNSKFTNVSGEVLGSRSPGEPITELHQQSKTAIVRAQDFSDDRFLMSLSELGITDRDVIGYCPNEKIARIFQGLKEQRKAIFIVATIGLILMIAPGIGGLLQKFFLAMYMAAVSPFVTTMAIARYNAGAIGWQSGLVFSANVILSSTLFIAALVSWYKLSHRSNAIALRPGDLALVQLRLHKAPRIRRTIPWKNIQQVTLRQAGQRKSPDDTLTIKMKNGSQKLRVGDILVDDDCSKLLTALQQHLNADQIENGVIESLKGSPVEQSYTELWLRELAAPLQRSSMAPLATGSLLQGNRYNVENELGVGGQATVYEATDEQEGRPVALKEFILPCFGSSIVRKSASEKFQEEALMLSRLNHPNIVKLLDAFIEDHRAYLVLEKISGKSLYTIVAENGPLDQETAIDVGVQACGILQYLHTQSPPVIHRDISPDNCMIDSARRLKLIDFSVAQPEQQNMLAGMVGKRSYISPEQFRGKAVTQSDIYSLGASLFFLLTGCAPEAISSSRPRKLCPSVTTQLDDIIATATALSVEQRYQSAKQFADALNTCRLDFLQPGLPRSHPSS